MRDDFIFEEGPQVHNQRRKEILEKYPQIKELYGNYPLSSLYTFLIVSTQFIVAYLLREQSIWFILLISYVFGAFLNHSLFAMIHECTHNNIFKKSLPNKFFAFFCDFPLILPSGLGFRKYHLIHHKHMGEYDYDPDIPSRAECRIIGNGSIKKAMWLFFFSVSQSLRPTKVKFYQPLSKWTVSNVIIQMIVNMAVVSFLGWSALGYLVLSTVFALGLHPLGGRWIQEHFIIKEGQETYSYYGPLNKLTFNIGYHNEHHDFMNVPWIHLPKIREIAPEYYNTLHYHESWTGLIWHFLKDSSLSAFSRITHPERHPRTDIE